MEETEPTEPFTEAQLLLRRIQRLEDIADAQQRQAAHFITVFKGMNRAIQLLNEQNKVFKERLDLNATK